MFSMKTLKLCLEETPSGWNLAKKLYYWFRMLLWYPIEWYFGMVLERIKRSYAYARFGWMHFDFDSSYIWDIWVFKLKRIKQALIDGHAVHEKEHLDALDEAIEICQRLFEENYDDKYHEVHNAKYGEIECASTKTEDGMYRWETSRKGVTPENSAQERVEFMKCWEDGEADRVKDLNRLNIILIKYSQAWWD